MTGLERLAPPERLGGEFEIRLQVGIDPARLRPGPLSGVEDVSPPDLERIETESFGRLVHL